jgi:peroxiredoxin
MRSSLGRRSFHALVAGTFAVLCASPALAAGRDLTGRQAPEIHVPQGFNGFPAGLTLDSLRGKVVVLKFWFTACGPCRASMPEFQALHDKFARRGVWFLAIAADERPSAEGFIRGKGFTFPVGIDPQGVTAERFGVYSFPTSYVVGADGRVKAYDRLDAGTIERELASVSDSAKSVASRTPSAAPRVARATSRPASSRPPTAKVPATPKPTTDAERNVAELGDVPAELADASVAAARNDYGEVLRILRRREGSLSGPGAASARRLREVAMRRFDNRVQRVQERWRRADYSGSFEEVRALARDFQGTEREAWAQTWVRRYEGDPLVRSLSSGTAVAARR